MNQQQQQRLFVSKAKTLANVMTKSTGLKVTVSGSDAYCDSKGINLPMGDFTDPVWREMLEGWIDHELGHAFYTCSIVTRQAHAISEIHHSVFNCIEDVWMEKAQGERFPGARINLERLAGHAIDKGMFQKLSSFAVKHPLATAEGLIIYRGRYLVTNQSILKEFAEDAYLVSCEVFGQELTDKLCAEIDAIAGITSSQQAFDMMLRIFALLQSEQDPDEQDKDQEDESDSGDQSEDDKEGDDDQSDDKSGKGNDGNPSDDDKGDEGDQSDEKSDNGGSGSQSKNDTGDQGDQSQPQSGDQSGSGGGDQGNQPSAEEIKKAIKALLSADASDGLPDYHEAVAEAVSCDAQEAQDEEPGLVAGGSTLLGEYKPPVMIPVDSAEAKAMSGRIYPALNKVLFDQAETLPVARNRGNRLIANKLSGVSAGNFSVFRKRVEQNDLSAAVSVLVDASSSMTNFGRMVTANVSALALAKGLHKAGIPVNVTYFGVHDGSDNRIYTAKHFDAPTVDANFGVPANGGTPTGRGMEAVLSQLVLRKEGRKVIFLVTDGKPQDEALVTEMVALAKSFNVKVVPLGIGTLNVAGFDKDEFVLVDQASDLPGALKQAVKNKLFN